jgi:hypothetical protein
VNRVERELPQLGGDLLITSMLLRSWGIIVGGLRREKALEYTNARGTRDDIIAVLMLGADQDADTLQGFCRHMTPQLPPRQFWSELISICPTS